MEDLVPQAAVFQVQNTADAKSQGRNMTGQETRLVGANMKTESKEKARPCKA